MLVTFRSKHVFHSCNSLGTVGALILIDTSVSRYVLFRYGSVATYVVTIPAFFSVFLPMYISAVILYGCVINKLFSTIPSLLGKILRVHFIFMLLNVR